MKIMLWNFGNCGSSWRLQALVLICLLPKISCFGTQLRGDTSCINDLVFDLVTHFQDFKATFLHNSTSVIDNIPSRHVLARLFLDSKSLLILTLDSWKVQKSQSEFLIAYYDPALLAELQSDLSFSKKCFAIFTKTTDQLSELRNFVKNQKIFIDSQFYVYDISRCNQEVKVYGLYRIGIKSTEVITEHGGPWTRFNGFTYPNLKNNFVIRRWDFRGYLMEGVGVKVYPQFSLFLPNGGLSGFSGDLVTILQRAHNFTVSYRVLAGNSHGKLIDKEHNLWDGMVGELQNNKADLTVSEISITKERTMVMAFTQPVCYISRKMYVGSKVDMRRKLMAVTTTMSSSLYAATFTIVLVLALLLFAMAKLREMLDTPGGHKNIEISVGQAIWLILPLLFQQGAPNPPTAISSRMVFWYGCVLSVIIFTAFSATLVSNLAVVSPVPLPFSDVEGLVRSSGWDAGNIKDDLFEVTASQTCAASNTIECQVLQTLWNKIILKTKGNLVSNYQNGLQRVLERNYVFFGVDVAANDFIRQLPRADACLIRELNHRYIPGGISIGLQYLSPFQQTFDHSLQRLRESGVIEKIKRKWLIATSPCTTSTVISMDMIDVGAAFLILLLGTGASLLFLFIERLPMNPKLTDTKTTEESLNS